MEFLALMAALTLLNVWITDQVSDWHGTHMNPARNESLQPPAENEPQTLLDALFHSEIQKDSR